MCEIFGNERNMNIICFFSLHADTADRRKENALCSIWAETTPPPSLALEICVQRRISKKFKLVFRNQSSRLVVLFDWEYIRIDRLSIMNTQSVMRRHPHSFSIEQILAKSDAHAPSNFVGVISDQTNQQSSQLVHTESGRGNCDVSRVSSPATSSCLEDGLDDGKSDIDLASDDGSGT